MHKCNSARERGIKQHTSHLSKDPCDLTQKCTQLPITILGTVFNALACLIFWDKPSIIVSVVFGNKRYRYNKIMLFAKIMQLDYKDNTTRITLNYKNKRFN